MLNLREIHKPKTIEDAIKLLRQPDTFALAGGTQLIASQNKNVRAVVDLSALHLAYIRDQNGAIAIGAMTTLADVNDSPILRVAANGILAQAAHRTEANILRNQATVAGTVISELNGILVAALLALDAQIVCVSDKTDEIALADFLATPAQFTTGALVKEIVIPAASVHKRAALETVARTPSDKPIVSVCAAMRVDGKTAREVRLALSGVGEKAVRARNAEMVLEGQGLGDSVIESAARLASQGLSPRGDYRGSVEYRQEMAIVLTRRAVKALTQ
jgi:carbon-monoxide dehydrogenase medium subunit